MTPPAKRTSPAGSTAAKAGPAPAKGTAAKAGAAAKASAAPARKTPPAGSAPPASAAPPIVEIDPSAQQEGLGPLLGDLISQNLEQHPERRACLERMRGSVVIRSTDAEVAATLECLGGRLVVLRGGCPRPDLTVSADSLTLLELTNARLRLGLPDPLTAGGRAILGKILRGRLKLGGRGLVLKPRLLTGLTKLLNVASTQPRGPAN